MAASLVQDLEWLHTDFVGISSKLIWRVMNGEDPKALAKREAFGGYPHDPDDFSRCHLLFKRNPEWRQRIDELRGAGNVWSTFVDHWEELEVLFELCAQGRFSEATYHRREHWDKVACRTMYDRMKELEKQAGAYT